MSTRVATSSYDGTALQQHQLTHFAPFWLTRATLDDLRKMSSSGEEEEADEQIYCICRSKDVSRFMM